MEPSTERWLTHLEHLLNEGVEGGKAVVRGCRSAEQEAHRITLVPEGGLHTDEDVAKLLAKHQQLRAIGVQVACSTNPTFSQRALEQFTTSILILQL
jgi:hypothetical protein